MSPLGSPLCILAYFLRLVYFSSSLIHYVPPCHGADAPEIRYLLHNWLCIHYWLILFPQRSKESAYAHDIKRVYALNNFREAVYEDPLLVFSNWKWNTVDSDPCGWSGVSCSMARDHVIKINISGASLRGFLSPNLHLISSLILHGNALIGTIPKEIGLLKSLKVLDLGSNQLTGPIPLELGNLSNIVKINLQSNGFTGKLPSELGNLTYLQELRLDRNKLKPLRLL